jgi:hypothetical protein
VEGRKSRGGRPPSAAGLAGSLLGFVRLVDHMVDHLVLIDGGQRLALSV